MFSAPTSNTHRPTEWARLLLVAALLLWAAACASAGDRLNQGIELQAQGRYLEAVYRYADAVEKDGNLAEARERLLSAGDSALRLAMDEADRLVLRDDPVSAAGHYQGVDGMLVRIRSVGHRLEVPPDYDARRRNTFDRAIEWQMRLGREASEDGRWEDARGAFAGARGAFDPTRAQVEESLEAETDLLLRWAEVELEDGRPRMAFGIAEEAMRVRTSTPRDVLVSAREIQEDALEAGTVVVAIPPVVASPVARDRLGAQFEIQLDEDLLRDHWTVPPPFVRVADPVLMRRELRGLLRGIPTTPLIVGRALELVGADLGALVTISSVQVTEEDVTSTVHEAELTSGTRTEIRQRQPAQYRVVEGNQLYAVEAEVVLVDISGREVGVFTAEAYEGGGFRRGEYEGNPDRLALPDEHRSLFDPVAVTEERDRITSVLMEELAVAIASGTYDTVLSRVP